MTNKNKTQEKTSRLNALIVEDNATYLACWKLGLGTKYNNFDTATNETDALNLLGKNKYDIIVTDGAFPENEETNFGDNLKENDYRGKNIAKLAKEKGAYVIGISEEPEKLRCNSIDKLMKKPVDINELKKIFHNINERGYK